VGGGSTRIRCGSLSAPQTPYPYLVVGFRREGREGSEEKIGEEMEEIQRKREGLTVRAKLCPMHTADADATKLFCRVGVGGVNTIRN